jgi:N-acetylglucosaminyldiphosphoundecaprenol N-acetyl-beta-D-mannosaminyltransferase
MQKSCATGILSPAKFYNVLGIPLGALQIPELISRMERWIQAREYGHCITFANVHVVMESQHDPTFNAVLKSAQMLNVPDGKPLVWVARRRGFALQRRVYGPELMHEFCASTTAKGYRHFFYGGAQGIPEKLATAMAREFPGINVVGTYSPPFRPLSVAEDAEVVEMINATCPDVLWLGLGCPKQEKWAFEHRGRLKVPVLAAVGQAFDIHAGVARQAPRWAREHGLEWLFRLAHEPRRLWKRYLFYNSEFLWCILLERFGLKHFS